MFLWSVFFTLWLFQKMSSERKDRLWMASRIFRQFFDSPAPIVTIFSSKANMMPLKNPWPLPLLRKCKQSKTRSSFLAWNAGSSTWLRVPDLYLELPLILAREVLRQEQQGRRRRQLPGQQRDERQHAYQRVEQEELGPLQEVVAR